MKKIQMTTLIFCLLISIAILAGCGNKEAEQKTITVATNVAFPPYEFYENEKAVGIDIDIMQAICDKLGYQMKVADMEFGSVITAVSSGKADVGVGAITITEDRAQNVHFTTSYATGIQSIILPKGSPINTLKDLAVEDVIIGVQQDTTGDIYATSDFGEKHIARFNKGADAVQALITGKCDAVIIDNSPAETFVSQNPVLTILPTVYAEEEYGFELSYDNDELYNKVNSALEELIEDGTVQGIIDTYINAN